MKELSKNDEAKRAQISVALADEAKKVTDAHAVFVEAAATYNRSLEAYNEVLETARGWCDDIARELGEYLVSRSARWQESEKGESYEVWRSEFAEVELDDLEMIDVPDLPDFDHETTLDELPAFPND